MPFLNRLSINTSRKAVTAASVAIVRHDGLGYAASDALSVNYAGTKAAVRDGIGFTSAGEMLVVDASAGLPADTVWLSGLPISAAQQRLCVDAINAVTVTHQGVGFTSTRAVAVA